MKKVVITAIIIVALGIGAFLIGENFIFNSNPIPVSSNNNTTAKENNATKKVDENQVKKENLNNNASNSNNLVNVKNSNENNNSSNSNVTSKNSNSSNSNNSNNKGTNNGNSSNTADSNAANSTNSANNTTNKTGNGNNSGSITYSVPPVNSVTNQYLQSAVVVTNSTGNNISSEQLNQYMRSWIMSGQNNCAGICDATGTYWEQPWLDKVPDSVLVQAFVDANGEVALSKNITAGEFVKATVELDRLTANDVPFTMAQAKELIISMITKDGYATASEITKITFNEGTPAYYTVYTKESGTWPFWTVVANTGYAHG
ncbi:MAG: hypothetical protein ACRDD2_08705 [Sarcina sp.]